MAALTAAGPWRAGQQTYPAPVVYNRPIPRLAVAPPVAAATAVSASATTTAVPTVPRSTRYPVLP